MDEGVVKFERKRNNIRSLLSNPLSNQSFLYPLGFDQTSLTGGIYNRSNAINFYSPDNTIIATMNKENGAITINPPYASRIVRQVDLTSNTPIITLYDTIDQKIVFTIKTNTTNSILSPSSPYELVNLSGTIYG